MSDARRPEGGRGQAQGHDQPVQPIPVGLEHVLALAGAHAEFREALQSDPDAALIAAGLELTSTERAILRATPDGAMDQMIGRVSAGLTTPDRRQFLERATAALAVLVGGQTLLGCDSDKGKRYGKPKEPVQVKGERKYGYPHGSMGARAQEHMRSPMPPPVDAGQPPPTRPSPAEANDPPERPRTRRADPVPHASMGIRPDSRFGEPMCAKRPRRPMSYGVGPDRPRRRSAPRRKSKDDS